MRDFYKKLMEMSFDDAEEIARDCDTEAVDEMALSLYQTRVKHWQLKAMDEQALELPDEPSGMYE